MPSPDRIHQQVVLQMQKTSDPEVLRVLSDPKLVAVSVGWVRSAIKVYQTSKSGPGGMGMAISALSVAGSTAKTATYATGSTSGAKVATGIGFTASQIGSTLGLTKLANVSSPAAAVTTIGFTFAEKILHTTSLVSDSDKAKCYNALAKTATNAGFMLFTGASGIGLVGFGIALAASAYEAGYYCQRSGAR